jgi:hypothetical protein
MIPKQWGSSLRSQSRNPLIIIVIMLFVAAGVVWVSNHFVMTYPGGEFLVVIRAGARAVLTEGFSPYSQQVQSMVATAADDWEAPYLPGRSMFIYPFYILLPAMPVALIGEYTLARTLWIFSAVLTMILLVLVASRLVGWRPKVLSLATAMLFVLFNPYTITAVAAGDFAVIVLLLATLALPGLGAGAGAALPVLRCGIFDAGVQQPAGKSHCMGCSSDPMPDPAQCCYHPNYSTWLSNGRNQPRSFFNPVSILTKGNSGNCFAFGGALLSSGLFR